MLCGTEFKKKRLNRTKTALALIALVVFSSLLMVVLSIAEEPTMSIIDELYLGSGDITSSIIIGNYLYVATWNNRIDKIDLSSFTVVDTFHSTSIPDTYGGITALAVSGNYLYAGIYDPYNHDLLKIDLQTLEEVDGRLFSEHGIRSMIIDSNGEYLYASTKSYQYIIKVQLSTLSEVAKSARLALLHERGFYYPVTVGIHSLVLLNGFLYAGIRSGDGSIKKFNLEDLSLIEDLNSSTSASTIGMIAHQGHLYAGVGTWTYPKIAKVNPATHEYLTLQLPASGMGSGWDFDQVTALKVHNGYLYCSPYAEWGRICKVDPSTLTKMEPDLDISTTSNVMSLTAKGNFIYASLYNQRVVKVQVQQAESFPWWILIIVLIIGVYYYQKRGEK